MNTLTKHVLDVLVIEHLSKSLHSEPQANSHKYSKVFTILVLEHMKPLNTVGEREKNSFSIYESAG
jgi:hypothetical protein